MPNKIVNDFSITIGTINGSGSQTANVTLLRALFKMGIPVSGKNLFPSNIQGLPTWYTIRVNKDGFIARRDEHEIVVAMNPNSFSRDLAEVLPGGAFFYADDIKLPIERKDITVYPMPVKALARAADVTPTCATTSPTWSTSASWRKSWASSWTKSNRRCPSTSRARKRPLNRTWASSAPPSTGPPKT